MKGTRLLTFFCALVVAAARPMLGEKERRVTYPEFYKLPGGRLLFLYRDGASGGGDLLLNQYEPQLKLWGRLQDNLILDDFNFLIFGGHST